MRRPKKANNIPVTKTFLNTRVSYLKKNGYPKSRWIEFCEAMIERKFVVQLYEARRTVSKYITVRKKKSKTEFKVRFSNHKPNKYKEEAGDCDFFVGRTHLGITTTEDAIKATLEFFGIKEAA